MLRSDGVFESPRPHYSIGRGGWNAPPEALSRIQLDTLNLLDRGLTNQEIAANLGMTVGAIKWHVAQIFCKLHARNRIEALTRGRELLTLASRGWELPSPGPMPEPLRKTEIAILGLLNQGMTNQEIANSLVMTVGTTKWHMNQIYGKLQVRNRIEALTRARKFKWL
jgi:DNA-binding NarL/FixJ family response regulator